MFKTSFCNVHISLIIVITGNAVGLPSCSCVNSRYVFSLASDILWWKVKCQDRMYCVEENSLNPQFQTRGDGQLQVIWTNTYLEFELSFTFCSGLQIISGTHTQAINFRSRQTGGLEHAVCVWPGIFPISTVFRTQDGHWNFGRYSALYYSTSDFNWGMVFFSSVHSRFHTLNTVLPMWFRFVTLSFAVEFKSCNFMWSH